MKLLTKIFVKRLCGLLIEPDLKKAIEWTNAIYDSIDSLEKLPERCPLAPENGEWGSEELRQLLFAEYPSKYRVIFHVAEKTVHVLQVRHGARRWMQEGEN